MAESLASNHDVAYVTLQREILRFWTRLVGLNVYVLVEGVTVTAHNYVISNSLTWPSEAQDIISRNSDTFRGESIFHGWISLNDVSSLSHSSDVEDFGILESLGQRASWLEVDYLCSVLECTTQLSRVQGQLKLGFAVNSKCCGIILYAKKGNNFSRFYCCFLTSLSYHQFRVRNLIPDVKKSLSLL